MSGELTVRELIEQLQDIEDHYGSHLPVLVNCNHLHGHLRQVEVNTVLDSWAYGVWLR